MFNSSLNSLAVNMVPTVTEWTSYTPTVGGGFGTATSISAQWRRVGSSMEVQGEFVLGTTSAAVGTITLPVGYTAIDTGLLGLGQITRQLETLGLVYNASTVISTQTNANSLTSSNQVIFFFSIPISGWAANDVANAAVFSGKLVQMVTASTTTTGSTSTVMPNDDTIPQNNEGEELLVASITPTNASSKIKITFCLPVFSSSTNAVAALFVDSTANALTVCYKTAFPDSMMFVYETTASSTTSRTYKVRVGPAAAGTFYWNRLAGGTVFGSISKAELIVEEILP